VKCELHATNGAGQQAISDDGGSSLSFRCML